MGITRKSLFGLPPRPNQGSTQTVRLVPLTQGVELDQPWPNQPPGSAQSMTNFWPLDGTLIPRSRLSSLNTIRTLAEIRGIAELVRADAGAPDVWLSGFTQHGILRSSGSISRASFVSAGGLGVAGIGSATQWQYAPAFSGDLSANMLVAAAANSYQTLFVLYQTAGGVAQPLYSYLTSAPKALAVGTFDNYVVAFNTSGPFITRVQWCVRGNPSNWTSEGSGFEDLLAMRGLGTAIRGTPDGRMILFSTLETWYAVGATYPAQFIFQPLETAVGCPYPATIADTTAGIVFVGSDNALRILPRGGGVSQIISERLAKYLRRLFRTQSATLFTWGVFDAQTGIYHLQIESGGQQTFTIGIAVNLSTGEWGFEQYGDTLYCGTTVSMPNVGLTGNEGMLFVNSTATVYSTNSLLATDSGSTVTSTWRSPPLGSDLPGNYKQLTNLNLDYRATSKSTVTLKISQDGGNNYEATGVAMSLGTAPVSGRVNQDVYRGGAFPTIELTSTSTGYELHRLDVTIHLGGRA